MDQMKSYIESDFLRRLRVTFQSKQYHGCVKSE